MITVNLVGVGCCRFDGIEAAQAWTKHWSAERDGAGGGDKAFGGHMRTDTGLNTEAANAVRALLKEASHPVSTTAIMQSCRLTRPTASRILNGLVKAGEAEELAAPNSRAAKRWAGLKPQTKGD